MSEGRRPAGVPRPPVGAIRRRRLRVALSIVLTVALLALFLRNVDLRELGEVLRSARAIPIAVAVAVALLGYWLRAVRWGMILRPVATVGQRPLVAATAVGYTAITLLPARMGDLIRPLLLSRLERRVPTSASLASILVERMFDLWTVVALFLLFLLWPPSMPLDAAARSHLDALTVTGWVIGAGLVLGTLALIPLLRGHDRMVGAVARAAGRVRPAWGPPTSRFVGHFLDGLRIVNRPADLVRTLLASLVVWLTIDLQLAVTLAAFDVQLPWRATFLLVALTVIGLSIPTPAGVGGFHAALQLGLTGFFGLDPSRAAGIAIVYHAVCFLPIAAIGLLLMPFLGPAVRGLGGSGPTGGVDPGGEPR